MVIIRCPFPGKTNHRGGKEGAGDDADDVCEKCYEEASPLGIVFYDRCEVLTHWYPTPSPNYGEEYPRP